MNGADSTEVWHAGDSPMHADAVPWDGSIFDRACNAPLAEVPESDSGISEIMRSKQEDGIS